MAEQQRNFRYEEIQRNEKEIRLITLVASRDPQAPIHCSLAHASLDRRPQYSALSYPWGDPSVREPIYLDGQPFQVTVNLVKALSAIRHYEEARVIWADAVCINQTDVMEKNHQVALMGEIYKSASQVFLWLGLDDEDIQFVLPILKYDFHIDPEISTAEFRANVTSRQTDVWSELMHVFSAPVWTRMWIVQEMALNGNRQVLCGSHHLDFKDLGAIATAMMTPQFLIHIPEEARKGVTTAHSVAATWLRTWWVLPDPDFLTIWYKFGYCRCLDPRDKIFALLSISSDTAGMAADYQVDVRTLYCTATKDFILQHRNLGALQFAWEYERVEEDTEWGASRKQAGLRGYLKRFGHSHNTPPGRQPESDVPRGQYRLPSWVPDFGADRIPEAPWFLQDLGKDVTPKIPWSERTEKLLRESSDSSQLHLLGVKFDRIRHIMPNTRSIDYDKRPDCYKQVFTHLSRSDDKRAGCMKDETLEESFWKTVSCNRYRRSLTTYSTKHIHDDAENLWREGLAYVMQEDFSIEKLRVEIAEAAKRKKYCLPNQRRTVLDAATMFCAHIQDMTKGYSFAVTERGNFTLVPDLTRPGDLLVALCGGIEISILRSLETRRKEDVVSLVGFGYVHRLDIKELSRPSKERRFILV
jgi:hypothetical protein